MSWWYPAAGCSHREGHRSDESAFSWSTPSGDAARCRGDVLTAVRAGGFAGRGGTLTGDAGRRPGRGPRRRLGCVVGDRRARGAGRGDPAPGTSPRSGVWRRFVYHGVAQCDAPTGGAYQPSRSWLCDRGGRLAAGLGTGVLEVPGLGSPRGPVFRGCGRLGRARSASPTVSAGMRACSRRPKRRSGVVWAGWCSRTSAVRPFGRLTRASSRPSASGARKAPGSCSATSSGATCLGAPEWRRRGSRPRRGRGGRA